MASDSNGEIIQTMPEPMRAVVREIEGRCREVWLFGSRANPSEKAPQDWDVLAFGNANLLKEFQARQSVEGLDLLIVYDGDQFEAPWPRASDGAIKRGSLTEWEWTRVDAGHATYRATKARSGEDFNVDVTTARAVRILGSAQQRIYELARDLSQHNFHYAADAFNAYLIGKAKTLDEAFGLVEAVKRGRPVIREERHLTIAREMLAFRLSDKINEAGAIGRFESELAEKYGLSDARKIREIYAEHQSAVMAEELLKRLRQGD